MALTYWMYLCIAGYCAYIVAATRLYNSLDASNSMGVLIERLEGSRIDYDPLPSKFVLNPNSVLSAEFRTTATSGILFTLYNRMFGDVAVAFIKNEHLFFVRKCGISRAFEVFRSPVNNGGWHELRYSHSSKGGTLVIDSERHFRQQYMGRCTNFHSLYFGGIPNDIRIAHLIGRQNGFTGCIKNVKINSAYVRPAPRYYKVSTCH